MFVLVALRERADIRFQLGRIAPTIVDSLRGGNARNGQERVHVVANALDLFQFIFDTNTICLGGGKFARQFLKLVFD